MRDKTYILKHNVYNSIEFPVGTIVKITDDYWGKRSHNEPNTGFTVVKGKLKGEKGCVSEGLDGWLLDNTAQTRAILKDHKKRESDLKKQLTKLDKEWDAIKTAKL